MELVLPTADASGCDPEWAKARIERFYRADHQKLWRSLLAYTGDPDLAAEAESEALAQALRRGAAIDDPAAWIWRTSYKVAAGLLEARHRQPMTTARPRIDR